METLEEWQAHVISASDHRKSYCGLYVAGWVFQDADHARRSVEQNTRVQPCPECWDAIQKDEKK